MVMCAHMCLIWGTNTDGATAVVARRPTGGGYGRQVQQLLLMAEQVAQLCGVGLVHIVAGTSVQPADPSIVAEHQILAESCPGGPGTPCHPAKLTDSSLLHGLGPTLQSVGYQGRTRVIAEGK